LSDEQLQVISHLLGPGPADELSDFAAKNAKRTMKSSVTLMRCTDPEG
jgi:hypothetical protein